ncbi:glycosyltransferase family 4 protein [Tolypothrix sp. FACHB-123]|uniref:glycosyltransferase family 4 protein n=1 Tax=Tolypothrix sp. FACHB-123 TaxID=2692868 RepID=UPI001686A330|nr:glycosyltransferase family 4 protein [Tolypothrix sp. FACHB-123]MBD2358436.1 glycosyltransferase family 4 protein [Tolypothrix sp. FACHB-123]
MNVHKFRVLVIASHPVPYSVPLFRLMAQHPKLDILVAYCSLQGVKAEFDSQFGVEIAWDIPLLDGYPWIQVQNNYGKPRLGNFFGLINLGLWKLISQGSFDAVISYTGYSYASFWIAAIVAKLNRICFIFSTDASTIQPRDRKQWKNSLKKLLLPSIFTLGDFILVSSTPGKQMVHSLGIPEDKIVLTPSSVDNDWWSSQVTLVDVKAIREQWNIPENAHVILFCAKLQPWKRPHDSLRAFAKANVSGSYLVFAGDGPLRLELEAEAKALGVAEQVRFLGFVNQSQLPSVYRSANLFVFSSEYEPFGVVVNEAMLCGCPVVVSDHVGAHYDLVENGETGFVYPCGSIDALAEIFQTVLLADNNELLNKMSAAAVKRMESWSPRENVAALVQGLERSVAIKPTLPSSCQ